MEDWLRMQGGLELIVVKQHVLHMHVSNKCIVRLLEEDEIMTGGEMCREKKKEKRI